MINGLFCSDELIPFLAISPGRGTQRIFWYVRAARISEHGDKLPWKWGLVSGFSSKTEFSELMYYKILKFFDKNRCQIWPGAENCHIFCKCSILKAKSYAFLSNESLVNGPVPQLGVLWTAGRRGVIWGPWGSHIPIPTFHVSAPPGH